jgi:hypothetical protein
MGGGFETQSGSQNQVTSSAPWKGQKPYLMDLFSRASALSMTPQQMYPGEMIAPEDAATLDARAAAEARARSGDSLAGGARDVLGRTLAGDYLDPSTNPWLDATYDKAAGAVTRNFNNAVLPAIDTRFATAGRTGGGAYRFAQDSAVGNLGRSLADLGVDVYGGNYQAERGRQDTAARDPGSLSAADYGDINALGQVGGQREQRSQALLDELVQRFDFSQNEPWQRLGQFAALIGSPITGKTNTYGSMTNSPSGGSVARSAVGGFAGKN